MTFEKALEAMKQGKVVERKEWDGKCRICMYHNAIYTFPFLRDFPNLRTFDITAPDWQIYEPEKKINPDAFQSVEFSSGEALNDLWLVRANRHAADLAKQVKKAFESYTTEPQKEESTMYTDLEITFKSGETITYKEGEWDDYSYDGKSVAVKKSGAWVGLYNFDNVFCVELKQRAEE